MQKLYTQLAALIDASNIGFDGPKTADNLMQGILNGVYFWAAAIAVIVIVVAGFMYTTSGGDSGQLGKARNAIFGACIGLVIILCAFVITNIVLGGF